MSDNTNTRETTEPVAWALCDDEGLFEVEQCEATAHEWVRGGADFGLVRWLRPLVFGDVAHQSAAAVTVTEDDEKITLTVGPVTEEEAVAALKRHGWTEQASHFGSFRYRSLVAPQRGTAALTRTGDA